METFGIVSLNQAVHIARQMNITLLGRVRGTRMNLYSGEGRIHKINGVH